MLDMNVRPPENIPDDRLSDPLPRPQVPVPQERGAMAQNTCDDYYESVNIQDQGSQM